MRRAIVTTLVVALFVLVGYCGVLYVQLGNLS